MRKVLKVPPTDVSDGELEALFGFLDFDNGGTIEQKELAGAPSWSNATSEKPEEWRAASAVGLVAC